jgi:hypothetical protein
MHFISPFSFPNSVWERIYDKLRFVARLTREDFGAGPHTGNRVSRECVPKRSLGTRASKAKRRARVNLEALESRLAPTVVGVNAAANVHVIDPNIYGSAFASTAQIADLGLPLNRDGGNASDTYSFAQDATNHGNDWYFESIASGSGNGQGMDSFVSSTKAGGAQPTITLNLLDWAAKLGANRSILGSFSVPKYGAQQATDPYALNWGNGIRSDGTDVTGNDPTDAYIPNSPTIEQAWIQHLIATFGNSQNGGVKYYELGNEPGLWNSTHRDIHPAGDTLPELRDRMINYASMVKALDPGAKILGPEEWGWTNYFISGADAAAQNWGATYNGLNAEAWLLDQLRQHDAATGQRLLDYFTLHFYPQGGQFSDDVSTSMELLRNRSTRSLWDPNYVDESWIASTGINGGKVNLINLMKSWVNTYYPGTKIGITEYNWGAEGDMNGATTQADIWGIFGREGLDLANRWTTPDTGTPTYLAMKMFRNYDGNGSAFGETSVGASVANPDQVDAFASLRASDGALTVMVINKNLYDPNNPSATTSITVNLSNFAAGGSGQEWQLAAQNPADQTHASIKRLADMSTSGGSFTVSVPMESVSLFVITPGSAAPASPTGLTAAAGNAQVTLTWNPVSGAASYKVYRGTASGGETLLQSGVTAAGFTDTGLTNGTAYYYRVSAVNSGGESALSAEASATPRLPAGPSGTTTTDVPTFVWNAVPNAASYDIWISDLTTGQGPVFSQSQVPAATLTLAGAQALSPGHSYRWWVRGVTASGAALAWGTPTDFTITGLAAPPPAGPNGSVGTDQPTFTWSAVSLAVRYDVWVTDLTTGVGGIVGGSSTTSFADNAGLSPGHSFRWWARAVSANGTAGPWSVSTDFGIVALNAPTLVAPNGLVNTDQPTYTWSPVALAARYDVWVTDLTTGLGSIVGSSTVPSFVQPNNLAPGHGYRWWARADSTNGAGGPWSAPADFTIAPLTAPTPAGPSGTLTTDQPSFSWSAVSLGARYEVWISDLTAGTGGVVASVPGTSYVDTAGLTPGHSFRWWVRADSAGGWSGPWSAPVDFAIPLLGTPVPAGPSGASPSSQPTFTWSAALLAAGYDVWLTDLTSGGNGAIIGSSAGTSLTAPAPLAGGHHYRWWVRAKSSNGTLGSWSVAIDFVI